jgi:CheY-like chemotaxis protein
VASVTHRILVVEDDRNLRDLLQTVLAGVDFEVESAEHGGQALMLLKNQSFAAVVLDLVLPWVNGIEVLSGMRADPALAAIPVVVITGTPMKEHELRSYRPLTVLHKPFMVDAVIEKIRRVLNPVESSTGR